MALVYPTPQNLRPPANIPLVDSSGMPTIDFAKFLSDQQIVISKMATITVYGRGDGVADDTLAFSNAIAQIIAAGGGIVMIPAGTYLINQIVIPATYVNQQTGITVPVPPIIMAGSGFATVIKRNTSFTMPAGTGMIDVSASKFSLLDCDLDAGVTSPTGLQYGRDFNGINGNDPMAASLTYASTMWVHGNPNTLFKLRVERVRFQHAAGYSLLLDALPGNIEDVDIIDCWLENNRPTLFGISAGQLIYGSWNGGVFIKGDGRTADSGIVKNVFVSNLRAKRNTGNCLWSHLYGLNALHQNFRFTDCLFEDGGLDGILVGGVTGGIVSGNTFRRIGYTTLTDQDVPYPRWLAGVNATALDSSGLVKGVNYLSNSFCSINGGCIDGDGHGDSAITGNICRTPYPDEPEYAQDRIPITGPTNSGPASYGINLGNTQNTPYGGRYVSIVGNTFLNLAAGSVRLYSTRNCTVESNNIVSPDVPINPPIAMGPTSTSANQRSSLNVVKSNRFYYNPSVSAPFVYEDGTMSPFMTGEVNYVYDNTPVIGASEKAYEFLPSPLSSSIVSSSYPPSQSDVLVETGANNAIVSAKGTTAPLASRPVVTVLLAHTLHAGANTYDNGEGPKPIKSHLNPAANIGTPYSVGGVIEMKFDGTNWLDLGQ